MEHAKGKWEIANNTTTEQMQIISGDTCICFLNYTKTRQDDNWLQQEANARLIAAAPDLLATANEMMDWLEEYEHYISDSDRPNFEKWQKVIAKAQNK